MSLNLSRRDLSAFLRAVPDADCNRFGKGLNILEPEQHRSYVTTTVMRTLNRLLKQARHTRRASLACPRLRTPVAEK